jgi:hypothetical protein
MSGVQETMTKFHLHLVSDATGETLDSIAKAALVQFAEAEAAVHMWSLVRAQRQLEQVLLAVDDYPGLVLFTLVDADLRRELEDGCRRLQVPCIGVLDPVMMALSSYLGAESQNLPGMQHALDADYFDRIDAMNYCMAHDDGQLPNDLSTADVILVGVSRTSKTPTCIYLANRGIKAANIPYVPNVQLPEVLQQDADTLIVGLTTSPDRLVQIRRSRLLSLKQDIETEYVDLEFVKDEVATARRLFTRNNWPVIDVSRRSIEETAAAIMTLHQRRIGAV